ncbi:tRNA (adenosine(37)-N6)-dimethylallyltransferase MiaA [Desulfovibrio inopinatus]|uniref:tRNA (adenosine(37)-N6)-dimethylallyltransferase MiaA n=1 Tax=Desulfovibrio inopinatus TaxID=102109 RepID=UPI000421DF01|nr:tRNA (adenosine(37)-N6)-dimethylallyltransferase MiaA [Desulfovibrio inopinatus]
MTSGSILVLVGATGTGKTAASLALAEDFQGAVVNLDSRQIYRDLPLVTAQPSPQEQAVCPHFLYGHMELESKVTAGIFVEEARRAVESVFSMGRTPILVGGTGMYLRALLNGLAPIPPIGTAAKERVIDLWEHARSLMPETPGRVLHEKLHEIDPAFANRIHFNDKQRLSRAFEVFFETGKPLTEWHQQTAPEGPRLNALILGIDTDLVELKPRLARRIDLMLEAGALDEMQRALLKAGRRDVPAFTGIGCPELLAYLDGDIDLDEAKRRWLKNTRAYAKRQLTWFRIQEHIDWFPKDDVDGLRLCAREWMCSAQEKRLFHPLQPLAK